MDDNAKDKLLEQAVTETKPETEAREPVVVDKGIWPQSEAPAAPQLETPVPASEPESDYSEVWAVKPPLERIVEALLFAAPTPVTGAQLSQIAGCKPEELVAKLDALNEEYRQQNRSFRIQHVAQGFQLYSLPEYSEWVKLLFKSHRALRLSRASLEVLAIVAYRQPVTKPEIEQLRGVDSTGPLVTLLERSLVSLAGRAHKPGNPFLYRTSKEFLRYFGLGDLNDMPRREELEEFLRQREHEIEAEAQEELNLVAGPASSETPSAPAPETETPEPDTPEPAGPAD